MYKIIIYAMLLSVTFGLNSNAQDKNTNEKFGRTLNLGIGVGGYGGHYGYVGHSFPAFNINYEFDVAPNFTLAPTISIYTYNNYYSWGNQNNPAKDYYYHSTIIPIGVKGAYYFDKLFKANPKWDFYLAASIGFSIINSRWDDGYSGDKNYFHNPNPMFLTIHAGTEYHFNKRLGIYLDLSSGVSTIGLAIH